MKLIVLKLAVFFTFSTTVSVSAHPGNTDGYGGHTCRTNCPSWGLSYGEYHYHNGGGYNYDEPDYYDQGYTFGSEDAIEENRSEVISKAEIAGTTDGRNDGESGESSSGLFAPSYICEMDFQFKTGEYQDYIDGVNDGWDASCPDIADEAYQSAYDTAYEEGEAAYIAALEEQEAESDEFAVGDEANTGANGTNWLLGIGSLAIFYAPFAIIGNWQSIKEWWMK